jgi:hypothetical protein
MGERGLGNLGKFILKANGPIQRQSFGSCNVDGCHDGGKGLVHVMLMDVMMEAKVWFM